MKHTTRLSIRRDLLALFLAGATASGSTLAAETDWKALAGYWAPVVVQGASYAPTIDVIGSMDYDGDWDLRERGKFKPAERRGDVRKQGSWQDNGLPSVVYYWVTEISSHYFIGYALYYPEGVVFEENDNRTFLNDMQGIVVAVRKVDDRPMGQFVALRSWGNEDPRFYSKSTAGGLSDEARDWLLENISESAPSGDDIEDVDFVHDTLGFHPVIYSRAGEHTMVGTLQEAGLPVGPHEFEQVQVVDWSWIPTIVEGGNNELRSRYHRPGNGKISGGGKSIPPDDGLLYRYEGAAMEVIGPRSRGKGTMLHHWNLVAYDLVSIGELWERRKDYESGQGVTFSEYGVFASATEPGPSSRAPWAWGTVFFDPAAEFATVSPEFAEGDASTIVAISFTNANSFGEDFSALQRD